MAAKVIPFPGLNVQPAGPSPRALAPRRLRYLNRLANESKTDIGAKAELCAALTRDLYAALARDLVARDIAAPSVGTLLTNHANETLAVVRKLRRQLAQLEKGATA
jgi:hypothetical protein